jgi:hypothetical protein
VISQERLEKALTRIARTDETCAQLKGQVLRTEFMAKVAEALAFKQSEASSAEGKKQDARLSDIVQAKWEEHFKAVTEYEKVRASREREMVIIEVFRTLESSRRMGARGNIQ